MREGDVEESTEMRKIDWDGKYKIKCSREESCCRNNRKTNSYCLFSNSTGAFVCNGLVLYVKFVGNRPV
jgi:hypothetical protein